MPEPLPRPNLRSLRFWLPILVLAALTAAVSAPVYIQRILTPTENDYGTHIIFTQRILSSLSHPQRPDWPPTFALAHPLLQIIIGLIYWAGRGHIGLWETGVLVQVLAQIAASLGIYAWLGPLEGRWGQARRIFFALTLTLVAPVMLLAPLDGQFYFGYIGLASYHNPTVHLLRPFALASFYFALRTFSHPRNPAWMAWLSAALIVAGALVKPSYAMTVLPAMALLAAWRLWKHQSLDWRLLIWGQAVPAVLILGLQTVLIYLVPDADRSGITLAPFQVESGFSQYLPLKFLLSTLFPLALLLFIWLHSQKRSGDFAGTASLQNLQSHSFPLPLGRGQGVGLLSLRMAGISFGCAVLQLYLLAETGQRFFDGNFRWGAQITLFLLFVFCIRWLLREGQALRSWQRWLLYTFYAFHLAGGIAYYLYAYVQPHYR